MTNETMRTLQGIAFVVVTVTAWGYLLSAIAAKQRVQERELIAPLGWAGMVRSFAFGLLTAHMAAGRFGWLPWEFVSPEATVIYLSLATVISTAQIVWWFKR